MIETRCAVSLSEAFRLMEGAEQDLLISRLTYAQLGRAASRVRAGAFDFDGTMHPNNTWASVAARMPEDLRAKDAAIRDWYWDQTHGEHPQLPLDHPDWFLGQMPENGQDVVDGAWVASDVQWYRQAGLTRQVFQAVGAELGARDGALELLNLVSPRVIISFGIENVIHAWTQHQGVNAAVAASRIEFDEEGLVSGNHPNIVTSRTKHAAVERFRLITGVLVEELLVVGDSVVDAHMMHLGGFNVLIVPRSERDKKLARFRENNLGSFWNNLTAILFSDSLAPLAGLIRDQRM